MNILNGSGQRITKGYHGRNNAAPGNPAMGTPFFYVRQIENELSTPKEPFPNLHEDENGNSDNENIGKDIPEKAASFPGDAAKGTAQKGISV